MDNLKAMEELKKEISANTRKIIKELSTENKNIYTQLESLLWLQKRLKLKNQLPPLRGWPVSPDLLLKLHTYITEKKPKTIVETGSGATTLVISDALRQNGFGHLYSLEHLEFYGNQTQHNINQELLEAWGSIKISSLSKWTGEHLNQDKEKPAMWYSIDTIDSIKEIDLLIVDGPPESTCPYARYPALPAMFNKLSDKAQVWMDDANRKDETEICEFWAKKFDMDIELIPLEKGLCILSKKEQKALPLPQPVSFNFGIKQNYIG
ncbi:class I SAM-dependent methyltransferase [Oceanimonas sp. AH20CE76]|uniref:class I SAM-dependent methyltransferase n=1 Tax=Oceanimonas sp. AH20CE76 TaxID=2977120 RepID=UPI0031FED4D8